MEVATCSAPFCVCKKDCAFAIVLISAESLFAVAVNCIETASPPESVDGLVSLDPLDKALKVLLS
jgi:hypothetical protein